MTSSTPSDAERASEFDELVRQRLALAGYLLDRNTHDGPALQRDHHAGLTLTHRSPLDRSAVRCACDPLSVHGLVSPAEQRQDCETLAGVLARALVAAATAVLAGSCTPAVPADQPGADSPRSTAESSPPGSEAALSPGEASRAGSRAPTTPAPTSWGPSRAVWDRAGDIVAGLTIEQQAGQVIVATYPGLEPPVDLVTDLHLGGVIVMGDNVPTGPDAAAALASVTGRLQDAADRPHPLLIGVDQEGGPVARVGAPATEFPPGMAHGAANRPALSRQAARASATELSALGFTMVFSPVADVTTPTDPTIAVRSPSDDPALVGAVATAQVDGYADGGIIGVLKHFPGHGSVPADSHVELPVQTAALEALAGRDLRPFQQAVDAGAPAVMVAHIDVRDVDPGVPSSLSQAVVTGVLRDRLGFDGVVVTDALGMAAITDRYASGESAVAALVAGSDVLLMPPDPRAARDAIVAAVATGELEAQRLGEAARRVVALALHGDELTDRPGVDVVGTHGGVSRELSAAAVTLVDGVCTGPYVGSSIRVTGGTDTDRRLLRSAAQAAGLGTGTGDVVVLLGGPGASGSGDVVVALDTPYGLSQSSASTASVALFGRTPEAFGALVDVLTGRAAPEGTLPVAVDGLVPPPC
jgi:beta-N-acetylhexosaminidase